MYARLVLIVGMLLTIADAAVTADEPSITRGDRTRGLSWGWGHSWSFGVPGFGKTRTDVQFIAFHPQLGWFVTDLLELYGEATLFMYFDGSQGAAAGLGGLAARYHLQRRGGWLPYVGAGSGLLWTSLRIRELDRTFNFQLFYGVGLRRVRQTNPGFVVELRNHHISNAGTAGENLGLNAATIVGGVQWRLR